MKKLFAIFLLLAIPIVVLSAEDSTALQALIDEAQKNNLDIRKQELAVQAAKDSISGIWRFEDSRIGVSGSYNYSESGGAGGAAKSPFFEELSVSIPIINQISLSGKINDKLESSVSLSINPLNSDTSSVKAEESYRKALNQLITLRKQTAFTIEESVLAWNTGEMNLVYLAANYKLASDKYDIRKKQYDLGGAAYEELVTDEQGFIQARQKYYDGQKTALKNQQTLYGLLGAGTEKTAIPAVKSDELLRMIATRDALIADYNSRAASTDKVKSLVLELDTLEKELGVLVPIQPGISISANMGTPPFAYGASASISISARDIKFKDVDDLKTQIAMKAEEIAAESYKMELDKQMLVQSVQIAREMLESSKKDLETADTDSKETEFYYKKGERTVIEYELSQLNKQSAEIRLYQGAIGLYSAQADYLMLF